MGSISTNVARYISRHARGGNHLKGFQDLYLNVKARICLICGIFARQRLRVWGTRVASRAPRHAPCRVSSLACRALSLYIYTYIYIYIYIKMKNGFKMYQRGEVELEAGAALLDERLAHRAPARPNWSNFQVRPEIYHPRIFGSKQVKLV